MKDIMKTKNRTHLALMVLFLTIPLYAMEKEKSSAEKNEKLAKQLEEQQEKDLIFLFDEDPLNNNLDFRSPNFLDLHNLYAELNTITQNNISQEKRFIDLPMEVSTIKAAMEAKTKFEQFKNDYYVSQKVKDQASIFYAQLNKKYMSYFKIQNKKDKKYAAERIKTKKDFIIAADNCVQKWRELKY